MRLLFAAVGLLCTPGLSRRAAVFRISNAKCGSA